MRILNGEKPGSIASQKGDRFETQVNPSAAARQGVTLPEALLKSAKVMDK